MLRHRRRSGKQKTSRPFRSRDERPCGLPVVPPSLARHGPGKTAPGPVARPTRLGTSIGVQAILRGGVRAPRGPGPLAAGGDPSLGPCSPGAQDFLRHGRALLVPFIGEARKLWGHYRDPLKLCQRDGRGPAGRGAFPSAGETIRRSSERLSRRSSERWSRQI